MRSMSVNILCLAVIIMTQSISAHSKPVAIPSVVGQEVYELYTDAHLFITHVYINGSKRKLSNAEGNGSVSNGLYSISGAIGYQNKLVLNGFLQAGKNEIRVVFEPTPDLEDVLSSGERAETQAIRDMYAHAVLTRGQLSNSGSGIESYDLDELIELDDRQAQVLENKLLRRFDKEKISNEVSVSYELEIGSDEQVVKATKDKCSLTVDLDGEESYFGGQLFINDVLIRTINGSGSTLEDEFMDHIKTGNNLVKLKVNELKGDKKQGPFELKLRMDCEMDEAAKGITFPEAYGRLRFGDFFDTVYVDLTSIEYHDTGEYQATFNFSE